LGRCTSRETNDPDLRRIELNDAPVQLEDWLNGESSSIVALTHQG
jgi:hypothetical protein